MQDQRSYGQGIKSILKICLLISILISFTPQAARTGAPFHKYGKPKIAYLGCNYQIELTTRFCEDSETTESCYCNNLNAFATMSHCYTLGHPAEIPSLLSMCHREFNKTISMDQFTQAHEYYLNQAKSIDEIPDYTPAKLVDFPVRLNDSDVLLFKGAYEQFLGNYDVSVDYGGFVVLYWVAVFALAAIGNWSKFMFPGLYKKRLTGPITNWFRKTITLPGTWGKYKTEEKKLGKIFDMLVPARVETIIFVGLLILCYVLTTINITYYEGDPLFRHKGQALLRYHAVRLSFLSSSLMPLLILFGGRNNFLQWVTKWEYSTFITLHRWISRIVVLMVMLHSILYSLYFGSNYRTKIMEGYVLWGVVGTVSGAVIMIQGLLVLRRKWYEVFLLLHIALALVFIIAAWLHVRDLYCTWFYFSSTLIWVFDRIIRIGRIWEFGFPYAKLSIAGDDTLKIVVPKPHDWEAIPGGHAFIHFLLPTSFWQSHPFTYTTTSGDEIVLYVKVKQGVTLSLYQHLLQHDGHSQVRVAIEGSYGEKAPASRYDNAVFVAGGSGIPGIFAEAYDLAQRRDSKEMIKLIWVVRDYGSIVWFYNELLSLKETNVETTVAQLVGTLSHIAFLHGKPDIDALVRANVEESLGSTCFITCGHPAMVDDIRAAVIRNIDNKERKRVDYYEKLQVWA
ncbi:ferric reductase [Spathaspora passalidarum NRRL Y-27907]|uniref:Ferric reductase n=1 Tax=Spathaspora passalidarum (strain NRRL Y-27907 / 11-Y1) TaxID=619300 RepID=G3ALW8_SPAPN|nr:ferric reductase [Spathaspora passalidarum NRRL Y-27907]EGW33321.1 ferric reductase [Spathaspora passalidarum NRRL Y-27907]